MQTTENTFTSWDGAKLFYRAWLPPEAADKAVLLFHRGHEHSGRWHETIDRLGMTDVAFFAWDQRGHGQSPGDRGDAASVSVLAKDADYFARHIQEVHRIRLNRMAIIASSVGAVIATT